MMNGRREALIRRSGLGEPRAVRPRPLDGVHALREEALRGSRRPRPARPAAARASPGPQSAGSSSTAIACGSDASSCSGRVMRSQNRDTGRRQSLAVTVGSPKSSSCCSTGSGWRLAKVSPGSSSTGRRFACASAAAVTRLVAPGPTEVVQAIMRRRRFALAKAIAACAIACSLCARKVGSALRCAASASPMPATLPWPKIANTPWKSGSLARRPSRMRCAARYRTSAWAIVRRIVFMRPSRGGRRRARSGARRRSCARSRRATRATAVASSIAAREPVARRRAEDRAADRKAAADRMARGDLEGLRDLFLAGIEAEQQRAVAERVAARR